MMLDLSVERRDGEYVIVIAGFTEAEAKQMVAALASGELRSINLGPREPELDRVTMEGRP